MSGSKVEVAWSPVHDDLFLTCKTDLNLYRTEKVEDGQAPKGQGMKISDDTYASLVATNSHQYIKCIAWYPKPEPVNLVALGLVSGKVILTNLGKTSSPDPHRLYDKELFPKHQRQCSYLAWNPVQSNLLAEGLERYRTDFSLLIWDVYQQQRMSSAEFLPADRKISVNRTSEPAMVIQKPMVELGSGETTLSMAWFSNEPQSLVTGMNNKFLRIFDLRDTARPQNAAYTKAVYGIKVDPLSQHRLASFHETHISIWDTRNFEKPVATLTENKNIIKISWCPTRSGLLECLTKDSSVVKLYDIQHAVLADEIEPPSAAERCISSPDDTQICSFDWHPTEENRMLLVSPTGSVKYVQIFERISLSWSPEVYLTWACSKQVWHAHTIKVCREANEDISMLIRRRAGKGYGIQKDLSENASIVGDDVPLRNFWLWVKYMKNLLSPSTTEVNQESPISNSSNKSLVHTYRGIKSLVCDSVSQGTSQSPETTPTMRTVVDVWHWKTTDGYRNMGGRKIYHSVERVKALELCNWTYSKDEASSPFIDMLEKDGQYERAAALAIFSLKIGRAIEVLHNGATKSRNKIQGGNINLNMVAMALSGFSDDRDSMWRDVSGKFSSELNAPYLRSMFTFLTSESDNYDAILNDTDLVVSDRVAFACFYLDDSKLTEFIGKLMLELTAAGDLSGILLTGFTKECLDLFQNYVDATGDVQTAAVALIQALPNADLAKEPRVRYWVETYRELLDTWRLWHERAEFDVYRQSCDRTTRGSPWVQPQVFVSCNFCGKSVSFNSLATRSRTFMFGGMAAHKPRVTSCPSCRKPLPRCALCLINMGTSAGGGKPPADKEPADKESEPLAKFSDWFTWCQSCRHGGHAEHMTQWYKEHSECPVTGCTCKCAAMDAVSSLSTDQISRAPTPS